MCRHTQTVPAGDVAWGYDYPMRTYFFQLFDAEGECTVWDGLMPMSNDQLIERLAEHGVVITTQQLAAYVADLPCCERGNAGPTKQMAAFQEAMRQLFAQEPEPGPDWVDDEPAWGQDCGKTSEEIHAEYDRYDYYS